MSTEQDQVRLMAERIARRVSEGRETGGVGAPGAERAGDVGSELAAVRASLEELQKRLAQIESHVAPKGGDVTGEGGGARSEQDGTQRQAGPTAGVRSPWLSGVYVPAAHPSQEKFGVEEAAVSELVDFFEGEKKCELEPGGKPCDHCAMCSARGF